MVLCDARCEIKDVVNEQEEVFFSDLNHPRHATKKGIEDAFCESSIYVVLNLFLKYLNFINFSIRQCLIDLHKNIIKSLF